MSGTQRRLERAQRREAAREKAKARTRRGLCSRCGQPSTKHPTGICPDGLGSFTWAMGRSEMDALIERLEAVRAASREHSADVLTRDEQHVLDTVVELLLGQGDEDAQRFAAASTLLAPEGTPREVLTPEQVAARANLPLHHVRALLASLTDKGYLQRGRQEPPS